MPSLEHSVSAYSSSSSAVTATGVTPAGNNRYGIAKVAFFSGVTVSSITWGGTDITANLIKSAVHDGSNRKIMAWYYYLNPPTSAADVVLTLSGSSIDVFVVAEAWSDVDQDDPYGSLTNTTDGASTTDVPANLNVSSAAGEVVTDAYYQWTCTSPPADLTVGAGQTSMQELENTSANGACMGTSYEAGAATVAMGWTNEAGSQYAMYAISLKPAAAVEQPSTIQYGKILNVSRLMSR